MKRLEVVYNRTALFDIQAIEDWLALEGADFDVIDRYVARLRERCAGIGDVPRAGSARDDLAPGLRTVTFEKRVLIAYVVREDYVEILNLYSHGRDYEAFYSDDDERG